MLRIILMVIEISKISKSSEVEIEKFMSIISNNPGSLKTINIFRKVMVYFSMINPEAIMRRLSSSPTRTSTPQISNFTTPKRTPMRSLAQSDRSHQNLSEQSVRPQAVSRNQANCSRLASLPSTPNANIQRTPLPLPTFRENQPEPNQNSNSNIRNEAKIFELF